MVIARVFEDMIPALCLGTVAVEAAQSADMAAISSVEDGSVQNTAV